MDVTTHSPRDERIALEMHAGAHLEEDGCPRPLEFSVFIMNLSGRRGNQRGGGVLPFISLEIREGTHLEGMKGHTRPPRWFPRHLEFPFYYPLDIFVHLSHLLLRETMFTTGLKKRQRVGSDTRLSTLPGSPSNGTLTDSSQPPLSPVTFNDPSTADVILSLHLEPEPESEPKSDLKLLHLHSSVLRRSSYFSALLSDRWQIVDENLEDEKFRLNLSVPYTIGSFETHLIVLNLLYTNDFATSIDSVASALEILHVALELLFEDCVRACVSFLEAVPWTEEEEKRVLSIVPLLRDEEAQELLLRLSPLNDDSSEEMLEGLILTAIHNHQNVASPKAFVAKLLRDFSSRDAARRVLDRMFDESLKVVKELLESYTSPDFRGDHNETEAIQRLNLHKVLTNGRHLLWLVERMIELRVAENAVKEWSDQASFTLDLQRAFRDDAWRNIVPGLPAVVLRCTCKLANAVVTGSIIACREVRTKLVKVWLPVLIVCRDKIVPTLPSHKSLYQELEETFLNIISTLPMSDAQELLQQCLSFSTRNVEDCPHLVSAFNTWFRRARRPPQVDTLN